MHSSLQAVVSGIKEVVAVWMLAGGIRPGQAVASRHTAGQASEGCFV